MPGFIPSRDEHQGDHNGVFSDLPILLGLKTYKYIFYETDELPNPRPAQPKKNWVKSDSFSHSK